MKEHWQHLFTMSTAQDFTLDEVRQRPERTELGDKPDDKEIIRFIRKAKSKKSPGDNNIPAKFWKALVRSDKDLQSEEGQQSFGVWRSVVYEFWEKGSCSSDWLQGCLKMLFKNKGMKPDLGNWRGIMLLDAASKFVCAIIAGRLTRLLDAERMEEQNGFMPHRGNTDGIFSLKIFLQKRKEHGLST